jgi:hypothetical protein
MRRIWNRGRSNHRPLSALLFGVFAAAALLLFIPSAGAISIVQLQSPAYLRDHGAAAEVTVTVVCRARPGGVVGRSSTPARATLTVSLTERVGNRTAGGVGTAASKNGDFRCDGGSHLVDVFVPAKTGAVAFDKGNAFGQATLNLCSPTCRSVTDSRTVRLR